MNKKDNSEGFVETTHLIKQGWFKKYKYFQKGHTCKYIKPKNLKYATANDLIRCDCFAVFHRQATWYYRPIELLRRYLKK